MKLIHTADIRLDRSYADQGLPPRAGRANRAHLRTRLQAILDRAIAWPADAVLITGNLLDLEQIDRDTVAFLREAFAHLAPIPVLISPGPRDPYAPTSPYATELWPENVRIFTGPVWDLVNLGDFTLYGFGHDAPEISANPFDAFTTSEDRPCIIMGPGFSKNLATGDSNESAIVNLENLAHPNLAYVALGHATQSTALGAANSAVAWCAAAPEGGGFSETGPHHYLEITIAPGFPESDGVVPAVQVNQVPISGGRFYAMNLDCTDLASGQALIDAIRPHLVSEPDRQCVRIVLEGALLPEIYDELTSIRDALSEGLVYLDLVDCCFVAENYAALAEQKTSLGAFIARINQEIEDAPDELRRAALCRSRDLALCAYRGQHLPIRAARGD
ncbi:MAG: hypothetical protein L3K26_05360 [Candidatus Hydrogenedentes bacterium]|nr:hypothetical protein [Candidatus Hydrogenedentota bacterium]